MKTRRSGLTVVEILVVVGIIAMLAGLLMPAVHTVQKMAKETKQKAQFTAIELGLAAFKSDYGDYPPSDWFDPSILGATGGPYCGAQKLAEAMLGWDLLGFHPDSEWTATGLNKAGMANTIYHAPDSLQKRKSRYVELETANPFLLGDGMDALFPGPVGPPLEGRTYVLCDVFTRSERRVRLPDGKMVAAGAPILYYKANPARLVHRPTDWQRTSEAIYDARDNAPILNLGWVGDADKAVNLRKQHPLAPGVWPGTTSFEYFYDDYILDKKVAAVRSPQIPVRQWPVRPDSYLLISAGMDGLYGTEDDICNFGR